MTPIELKQVILDYFITEYKRCFIGDIKVTPLQPTGYKVSLNLNRGENPFVIISDLPDEEFVPFIKEELRRSKLHKTEYFNTVKVQPNFY